jgi:DnaJ-class molecular chaperone
VDYQTALQILKVDEVQATNRGIQSAFRDAVKQDHPDNGGSGNRIQELIDARDVALKFAENVQLPRLELTVIQTVDGMSQCRMRRPCSRCRGVVTMVTCDECGGYGVRCRRCRGRGRQAVTCEACHNFGYVLSDVMLPEQDLAQRIVCVDGVKYQAVLL